MLRILQLGETAVHRQDMSTEEVDILVQDRPRNQEVEAVVEREVVAVNVTST